MTPVKKVHSSLEAQGGTESQNPLGWKRPLRTESCSEAALWKGIPQGCVIHKPRHQGSSSAILDCRTVPDLFVFMHQEGILDFLLKSLA